MTLADTIIFKDLASVKTAISQVEHLNFIDEYGYTPLMECCIINDIEKAKLLIENDADINKRDLVGGSALHWAVDNNNLELCKLLIEHGADVNAYYDFGQSVIVKAILRNQIAIKNYLIEQGANLTFAYDFINVKLMGHRFELISTVDMVTHLNQYTQVEFEGFHLDFTLNLITFNLHEFMHNYAGREYQAFFPRLSIIADALKNASELIKFQHHLIKAEKHQHEIDLLCKCDPLIIPITQEGHALTLIRHGNLVALCDRMNREDKVQDKIPIYYMNKPSKFTPDLIRYLAYEEHPLNVFHKTLPVELGLQPITELEIPSQVSGNCTWANVEACIPTLLLMMNLNEKTGLAATINKQPVLALYYGWRNWDQDRSLQFAIQNFKKANSLRKASIASLLAAILFQHCRAEVEIEVERAMKIIPILKIKNYEYLLENYIRIFHKEDKTELGANLVKLLKIYADRYEL